MWNPYAIRLINLVPKYDFDSKFYKMPSYIRRASISEAIGKVSSYKSNLGNWENNPIGKKPTLNTCGYVYPSLYRVGMYNPDRQLFCADKDIPQ